jgi:hypothetical protein
MRMRGAGIAIDLSAGETAAGNRSYAKLARI